MYALHRRREADVAINWGDTRVVAVPVDQPQFAAQFLDETGLRAGISTDFDSLKQVFGYTSIHSAWRWRTAAKKRR